MRTEKPQFQFRLIHLFAAVGLAALFFGAYRLGPELVFFLGWLVYAAGLIYVMAIYRWSDIAMSVCFLLIMIFPCIAALFLGASVSS
jgi:hypothetical protein